MCIHHIITRVMGNLSKRCFCFQFCFNIMPMMFTKKQVLEFYLGFLRKQIATKTFHRKKLPFCCLAGVRISRVFQLPHDGSPYHIETNLLICTPDEWTRFYIMGSSVKKELICSRYVRNHIQDPVQFASQKLNLQTFISLDWLLN